MENSASYPFPFVIITARFQRSFPSGSERTIARLIRPAILLLPFMTFGRHRTRPRGCLAGLQTVESAKGIMGGGNLVWRTACLHTAHQIQCRAEADAPVSNSSTF